MIFSRLDKRSSPKEPSGLAAQGSEMQKTIADEGRTRATARVRRRQVLLEAGSPRAAIVESANFPDIRRVLIGIEAAEGRREIDLPGTLGFSAMKILADDPAATRTPAIAISANAMPIDAEESLDTLDLALVVLGRAPPVESETETR